LPDVTAEAAASEADVHTERASRCLSDAQWYHLLFSLCCSDANFVPCSKLESRVVGSEWS